jgi:hypothetical protein
MTYTPRTVADPVMNQIAKRLKDVQWQFALTTDEENNCLELEKNPNLPKHLITLMRDYKTWVIRMYLAGAQRTFGFYSNAKSLTLFPAFRYADMIRMYFWSYKHRDAFEPGDSDLNISAERAKLDLVHETEVVQIIKDIEAHLLSIGAIINPTEIEQRLKEKNKGRWARPTLKGTLADYAEAHRLALGRLETEMKAGFARLEQSIKDCVNTSPPFHMPTVMAPPDTESPLLPPYRGQPQPPPVEVEEVCEAAPCS